VGVLLLLPVPLLLPVALAVGEPDQDVLAVLDGLAPVLSVAVGLGEVLEEAECELLAVVLGVGVGVAVGVAVPVPLPVRVPEALLLCGVLPVRDGEAPLVKDAVALAVRVLLAVSDAVAVEEGVGVPLLLGVPLGVALGVLGGVALPLCDVLGV